MSISRLPSGRFRAQVVKGGKNVSVSTVLDAQTMRELGSENGSFPNKTAAKRAREEARRLVRMQRATGVTVRGFWERWCSDPLFSRPKESTNKHNRERTRAFVERYGDMPIERVGDDEVGEWLRGGARVGTVAALRAMFNDAASAKAGRLVKVNPFSNLGLSRGDGNRYKDPPSEDEVWALIRSARKVTCPAFAAWLQVACFTGCRPGELDALRWDAVDFDAGRISVVEQFNAGSRTFTSPKNGKSRVAIMTPPAREALLSLPRDTTFCFKPLRSEHYTPSARAYHWKAARAGAGLDYSLYLSTRHFFGSYAINVLGLASEDVAIALGHSDGGELVRRLYGHRNRELALGRVAAAYAGMGQVRPLRVVGGDAG